MPWPVLTTIDECPDKTNISSIWVKEKVWKTENYEIFSGTITLKKKTGQTKPNLNLICIIL